MNHEELLIVFTIVRNWLSLSKVFMFYSSIKRLQAETLLIDIWKHTDLCNKGVFCLVILSVPLKGLCTFGNGCYDNTNDLYEEQWVWLEKYMFTAEQSRQSLFKMSNVNIEKVTTLYKAICWMSNIEKRIGIRCVQTFVNITMSNI